MKSLYKLYSTLALLLACVLLPAVAMGQTVLDLTAEDNFADHNGARFIQEDASEGAGTGILDPFVRTKNDVNGVTASMNTGSALKQFQTEDGPWTTSLLLSSVTEREIIGEGIFKEFILDINQTRGNAIYGMTEVQLWADDQDDLDCYDPTAGGSWGLCDSGPSADRVYWLDENTGGSFPGTTGDATVLMDYSLESGSGNQTDIVMLIRKDLFPDYENCDYGNPACSTYLFLYSRYGDDLVNGSPADDGFEEWSTLVQPFILIDKTVSGTVDETHDWDLTKDVDETSCDQFFGGTCTFNYTVELIETTDEVSASVGGTVTYSVPQYQPDGETPALNANVTVVSDVYSDVDGSVVFDDPTCAVGESFTVNNGDSKVCTYTVTFGDPGDADTGPVTNTVTASVEFTDLSFVGVGNGTVTYNLTGFPAVDVTDTVEGPLGSGLTDGETFEYAQDYDCSDDEGDYTNGSYSFDITNIAEITQTGDDDTETVTVNCYAPVVSKTAAGSYDENYDWTIDKTVDPDEHNLFIGEDADSDYDVAVDLTYSEDDFKIWGTITVQNPHPSASMDVTVADLLDAGNPVVIDCGGGAGDNTLTVSAASSDECSYTGTPTDRTATENTATVTYATYDFDAMADVSFDVEDVNGYPEINVDDSIQGDLGSATDDFTFEYTDNFECPTDTELYVDGQYDFVVDNTATIVETGDDDDASVHVYCYAPVVSKDAEGTFSTSRSWTIDKVVSPTSLDLFDGESGEVQYTITLDKTVIEAGYAVSGKVYVTNHHPSAAMAVEVADELNDATAVVLDCGDGAGDTSLSVAADSDGECDYSASPSDDSATLNTATVTFNTIDFEATAAVSFSTEPTGYDEVNVTDTNGESWGPIGDDDQFQYTRTFECGEDEGTNPNTASIDETGASDDASVEVNCYDIEVTKDASTSYTRTWDWMIDKWAEPAEGGDPVSSLNLAPGESYFLTYMIEVDLDGAAVDSDWYVYGSITVSNVGNPIAAEINDVTDIAPGAVSANVDCGVTFPHTIAAGGTLECTYDADLLNGNGGTNTATAELQLYDYDYLGVPSDGGTRDVDGTAAVSFGDPSLLVDECTDVSDPMFGGDLGQVCFDDPLPFVFDFDYEVAVTQEDCGEFTIDNTATETEVDNTDQVGTADWSILVTVNCPDGCTLTQGYWKTHNDEFWGGAPTDDNWENVSVYFEDGDLDLENELENFFLSGDTWFGVFWTAPKGNAYYNLAHQWMAAWLNCVNTTDTPDCSSVQDVLDDAQAWLEANGPDVVGSGKGKNKDKDLAAQLTDWAGTLGSFNEGLIGPGHCDENDLSLFTAQAKVNVAGSVEAAVSAEGVSETPSETKGDAQVKAASVDEELQIDGVSQVDSPAPAAIEIPSEFQVGNYPNPFNPTTTIQVALPEASHVRVAVYDVLGRMVTMLVDGQLSAGTHSVTFDAGSFPSGVYLYRFEYDGGAITKTMQLLK